MGTTKYSEQNHNPKEKGFELKEYKRDLRPAQQEEEAGLAQGKLRVSSAQGELCWHWGSGGKSSKVELCV